MALHPALIELIDSGVHGHVVTINRDGSPQVSVMWVGHDGEEVLLGHLGTGQKMRNIERDPRVAISMEGHGVTKYGLRENAVVRGTARITDGGVPGFLNALTARYMGPDGVFPVPDPPPGRMIRVAVDHVGGSGPWISSG